jgi:hypothetical protein
MDKYVFVLYSSITFATRVRKMFEGDSRISLMHAPQGLPIQSCAYALKVPKTELGDVLKVTKELDIKVIGIYVKIEGEYEQYDIS